MKCMLLKQIGVLVMALFIVVTGSACEIFTNFVDSAVDSAQEDIRDIHQEELISGDEIDDDDESEDEDHIELIDDDKLQMKKKFYDIAMTKADLYPQTSIADLIEQPLVFTGSEQVPPWRKDLLQTLLNEIGDPTPGQIDINGINTWYEDGYLYMEAFVRNGMSNIINLTSMELTIIIEINGIERVVASDTFSNFVFGGRLLPTQSVFTGFRFSSSAILMHDADLSSYIVRSSCLYR